jgi:hypothetical protein
MRKGMTRIGLLTTGALLAIVSFAPGLHASVIARTPEIDGSTAVTAAGLLAAGIMILRARRRPK